MRKLWVIIGSLTIASGAHAQGDAASRLNELLKQRYAKPQVSKERSGSSDAPAVAKRGIAPTRGPNRRPATSKSPRSPKIGLKTRPKLRLDTPDALIIGPGGKVQKTPIVPTKKKRSDLTNKAPAKTIGAQPADKSKGILEYLKSLIIGKSAKSGIKSDNQDTNVVGASSLGSKTESRSLLKTAQLKKSRMRSQSGLAVIPGTYLVQIKYGATPAQLSNLEKFLDANNYQIDRDPAKAKFFEIGMLYIIPKAVTTRSSSPPGKPKTDATTNPLDPQVLKAIRKLPGVNAASVLTNISPKSMPPPSQVSVVDDGETYDWTWDPNSTSDGNWGIKRMRMPSVWRVIERFKKQGLETSPVPVGILDSGFSWHDHLTYNYVHNLKPGEDLVTAGTCDLSHGTHVAGVVGASHGQGHGIDGIVPDAKIDAIPLSADFLTLALKEGIKTDRSVKQVLFPSATLDLDRYLRRQLAANPEQKQVVNISLGYNWRPPGTDPEGAGVKDGQPTDEVSKAILLSQVPMLQQVLSRYQDNVIFVVAAGNDSEGLEDPLNAKWASPLAYLALESSLDFASFPNMIVVEAVDRSGQRASFSNRGGHVSAPGVDIMSTVGGSRKYAICEGTSQAAPHVSALAAILMELAPDKKPEEIVQIIRETAIPHPEGTVARRVDALEAVLKLRPDGLQAVADLNNDGVVSIDDLRTFGRQREAMDFVFASFLGAYFFDFNDDGEIKDTEHWFPLIDLNGSGQAEARSATDRRCIKGQPVSDLAVLKMAWPKDASLSFEDAIRQLKISEPTRGAAAPKSQCQW